MNIFAVLFNFKNFHWIGWSRKSIRVVLVTLAAAALYFGIRGFYFWVVQSDTTTVVSEQIHQYETLTAVVFSFVSLIWVIAPDRDRKISRFFLRMGVWLLGIVLLGFILPIEPRTRIATGLNQFQLRINAQFPVQYLLPTTVYLPVDLFFASILGYSIYSKRHLDRREQSTVGALLKLTGVFSFSALVLSYLVYSLFPGSIDTLQFVMVAMVCILGVGLFIKTIQTGDQRDRSQQLYELLLSEHSTILNQTTTRLTKRISYLEKVAAFHRQSEHTALTLLQDSPEGAMLLGLDGSILEVNQNGAAHWGVDHPPAKGKTIYALLLQGQRDALMGRTKQVLKSHQSIQWDEACSGRVYRHQLNPIESASGSIISFSEYSQDITERVRVEKEAQRRNTDLEILDRVVQLIADNKDITSTLLALCELLTNIFQAAFTYVLVPSEIRENATSMLGYDRRIGRIKPILVNGLPIPNLPQENGAHQQRKSFLISSCDSPLIPACIRQLMLSVNIPSAMLLPFRREGELKGMVMVCRQSTFDPTQLDDTRLAEAIVSHMAQAIEHDNTVKMVKEKAVRDERDRLARDMHDSVTQTIYSASLITEALPSIWDRNPEETKRNLIKIRQLVRGALGEMRTILFELRPSALEMASLETSLRQLGFALAGRFRIVVQLTAEGDMPLPVDVKTTIYRISQEIFNNIAKHAEATQVQALLKMNTDGLTLNIADNGKGFNPAQIRDRGMGLQIIEERAAMIGARIAVDSEPGQGTNVTLTWARKTTGG